MTEKENNFYDRPDNTFSIIVQELHKHTWPKLRDTNKGAMQQIKIQMFSS
jgi:hypothetical protein